MKLKLVDEETRRLWGKIGEAGGTGINTPSRTTQAGLAVWSMRLIRLRQSQMIVADDFQAWKREGSTVLKLSCRGAGSLPGRTANRKNKHGQH